MTADLEALPLEELRRRRDAVHAEEELVSFRRRLLQAQLDIVEAAADVDDEAALEDMLARVLADRPGGSSSSARAVEIDDRPVDVPPLPVDVVGLSAAEREELLTELREREREVSQHRQELLHELDELQDELVRRFRRDGVDARALLEGEA